MDLQKLTDPLWSFDEIEDFYGYSKEVLNAFGFDQEPVDREQVERKLLLEKNYLSPKYIATEWGIREDSVRHIADYFKNATHYGSAFPARPFGGSFIVQKDSLESWLREVLDFRGIWRSIPARTLKIQQSIDAIFIKDNALASVEILEDVVFTRYPDALEALEGKRDANTPPIATTWCAITGEPVALAHSEHLQTKKSVALRPDRVGWHALLDDPSLDQYTMGTLAQFRAFEKSV